MKAILLLLVSIVALHGCATPSQMAADSEVRRLCAIDGGITVYERVKLPAARFDQWGNASIPAKRLASDSDKYYYEREYVNLRSGDPQIIKTIHKIIRRSDGKILGESIRYGRGGGDIPGPWHPSSFICPEISKSVPSIESSVFIKGEEQN